MTSANKLNVASECSIQTTLWRRKIQERETQFFVQTSSLIFHNVAQRKWIQIGREFIRLVDFPYPSTSRPAYAHLYECKWGIIFQQRHSKQFIFQLTMAATDYRVIENGKSFREFNVVTALQFRQGTYYTKQSVSVLELSVYLLLSANYAFEMSVNVYLIIQSNGISNLFQGLCTEYPFVQYLEYDLEILQGTSKGGDITSEIELKRTLAEMKNATHVQVCNICI